MVPARLAFAGPATHRYCASLFCACRSAGELWSRRCRAAALVAHRCCSVVQVGGAGVCVSVPSRCIPSRPIYCSPARRHRILAAATRKNFRLLRTQQNRQQNVVARIPEQRNTRFYGIAFISWPPVRLSPELWPNRFHTARGHCGALWKRWRLTDSDLCLRGRDPDDVSHCPLMPSDEAGWRFVQTSLCRWWCGPVASKPRRVNPHTKEQEDESPMSTMHSTVR